MQILVVVGRIKGENPLDRKGKGSWATSIGPGLVGPKRSLIMIIAKGKRVHIPVPRIEIGDNKNRSDACG